MEYQSGWQSDTFMEMVQQYQIFPYKWSNSKPYAQWEVYRMTKMKFYLAPMEGSTGFVFRNAYQKHFGNIDTYLHYLTNNKDELQRDQRHSRRNIMKGWLVPQILTNRARFSGNRKRVRKLWLRERYPILGACPGRSVAKHRGAGFLRCRRN